MKKISIVIPVRNEIRYISDCLGSILRSDYPVHLVELLIVDGMSNDHTRDVVRQYANNYSCVKLLDNQYETAQFGINIGIRAAKGDYVFIVSAHAQYPSNYFYALVETMLMLNADCVGGVLNTDVKTKNKKSEAIKVVLSDILGVGNSVFRIGSDRVKEVDTVAYGCYRADIFKKYGLFDERLRRNQDIEFNKRIKRGGAKIYVNPAVTVTYYARDNFLGLAKNNYSNGYWNILTTYYTKTFKSLNARHFIPLVFVLSIFLPILLSFVYFPFIYFSLLVLLTYVLAVTMRAIYITTTQTTWFLIVVSFFVLHWSYGFGSLAGLFKVTFLRVINAVK